MLGDKMSNDAVLRQTILFNAVVEVSLRALILLTELSPPARDVEDLVIFDYILVHSGDVAGGPPSLHPPLPHRTSELFVRRGIIRRSLDMLEARRLVVHHVSTDGSEFSASVFAGPFLSHFRSVYAFRVRAVAGWMKQRFGSMSRSQLREYVNENIGRWGAEMDLVFQDYENAVLP